MEVQQLDAQLVEICERDFHKMGPAQAARTGMFHRLMKEQENDESVTFVAHENGEYAGHSVVVWKTDYPHFVDQDIPEIQNLNVLPDYRRRGVGTALITRCEEEVSTRSDVVGIGVGLHPGYNNAQKLYPKLGYIPDGHGVHYGITPVQEGERPIFDDDLALFFTKRLKE